MKLRLRRRPRTPRRTRYTSLAWGLWQNGFGDGRPWTRYPVHDEADGSTMWVPHNNWDRDPTTGQLWITCFCGMHRVLPMMLGEYYVAHPEVHA